MIKNEMTNNEKINLFNLVASVGVEATSGILNNIDGGVEDELMDMGFSKRKKNFNDIASLTSYEEGCKEVISYFEDYCLNEDEEESVDELEELKGLLVELKEKTEGKNVKWILWGIETDIALGFIE